MAGQRFGGEVAMSHQLLPKTEIQPLASANWSAQSVPTPETKLQMGTPSPLEGWTEASDILTCTISGWYLITARIYVASGTNWRIYAKKNTSTYVGISGSYAAYLGTFACLNYFAVGDTLEVFCNNGTGTIALITTYPHANYLKITRLGA